MVHSEPSQSFGITALLFSGYTISLSGRVSGECWQSWAISSASCVLRSYLESSFWTWKKWPMCCYVSWRRSFHPPSSIRCSICFYIFRMRHGWGGLCSNVGAIQLTDVRRSFEWNAKINVKLKLLLQSHIFWRRCQTSQPNTMVTIFSACIIHPLVTMLAIMNRVSASSEDNLDARYKTLNHEEWRRIMLYVLTNLSEVEPYIA